MSNEMKNLSSSNVQTVVLVLNMQEGMCKESKQIGNDSSIPKDNRQWLQRKENEAAENRKGFFNDLAEDIQGFLNKMRNYGAHIVWGLSDEKFNERLGNIYHGMSANEKMDSFLTKTDESAYKENVEFFEKLKRDAEADGKTLPNDYSQPLVQPWPWIGYGWQSESPALRWRSRDARNSDS